MIDPRTTWPLDEKTLIESAKKTSRAIVMDEGYYRYGVTAEIASVIAEGAFYYLDGPVKRIGAMHVPDSLLSAAGRRHHTQRTTGIRAQPSNSAAVRSIIEPNSRRQAMALKTYGPMAVDWEQRIDFDRLRRERLARIKSLLAKSEMGALLCFDMNNVRYITATHIGTWAQDKNSRFTLLPQNDEPILWDFGSAAKHHQLNCPWLGERSRAGIPLLRGAMSPEMGRAERRGQEDSRRTGNARPA